MSMIRKDNRTNAYTVRYNEAEDALVSQAASDSALEVASWIRMVSIAAAKAAGAHPPLVAPEMPALGVFKRGAAEIDKSSATKRRK
jgi:hypothetical protein